MAVQLSDFITLIENFMLDQLTQLATWVATRKYSVSGTAVPNTLTFENELAGKKLTVSYKLLPDGGTVIEIAYGVLSWVTSNPQVIAYVQALVQNWISQWLPPVTPNPVANTK